MLGQVDPYVGRYFSQEWVKRNILHLSDEELEEMQKQIDSEPEPEQLGPDGNPMQQGQEQPQVDPNQYPPEDNVSDKNSTESETPELDSVTGRFSRVLSKK
jgi:hypothetical protein